MFRTPRGNLTTLRCHGRSDNCLGTGHNSNILITNRKSRVYNTIILIIDSGLKNIILYVVINGEMKPGVWLI